MKKGVQDRRTEVLEFAQQIYRIQNTQTDVRFADYAEGFSVVGVLFELFYVLFHIERQFI